MVGMAHLLSSPVDERILDGSHIFRLSLVDHQSDPEV